MDGAHKTIEVMDRKFDSFLRMQQHTSLSLEDAVRHPSTQKTTLMADSVDSVKSLTTVTQRRQLPNAFDEDPHGNEFGGPAPLISENSISH